MRNNTRIHRRGVYRRTSGRYRYPVVERRQARAAFRAFQALYRR